MIKCLNLLIELKSLLLLIGYRIIELILLLNILLFGKFRFVLEISDFIDTYDYQ